MQAPQYSPGAPRPTVDFSTVPSAPFTHYAGHSVRFDACPASGIDSYTSAFRPPDAFISRYGQLRRAFTIAGMLSRQGMLALVLLTRSPPCADIQSAPAARAACASALVCSADRPAVVAARR
ncbi:hypothetical protein EAM_P220 (plasmid) [Erwinia amylovora ATCC 49946]|nr:hypothetical protein EAM_P220 [Erwinia amylovora ATCC 49946]